MAKKNMKERNTQVKKTADSNTKTDLPENETVKDAVNTDTAAEKTDDAATADSQEKTEAVKKTTKTAESEKKAESAKKAETEKKAESAKKAETEKKAESAKKAETEKKAESAKKAETEKKAESTEKTDTVKETGTEKKPESKKKTAAEKKAETEKDAVTEEAAKEKDVSSDSENGLDVKSSKEIREARKELEDSLKEEREDIKNREKEVKLMRQEESKKRRAEMVNSVVEKKTKFHESAKEMSSDLSGMLTKEIAAMKRIKKTRSAEILAIFAKHNFYIGGFTPAELRTTLEDLGPTYVKIGQIMSSRVDMLPESYCKELEKLRQNVKELDPAIAKAVIEQETGKKINEIFSEFVDKPIGSASIGQAHRGTLLDGTKVVIKVQRPLIADMMRDDFVMLKKVASLVNTIKEGSDEDTSDSIDLLSVISELEKVTNEELDFRIEAENTIFFKEHCIEDETKINCPTIYPELTTERIMTMSLVDGYSVSKRDKLIEDGYDPNEIGATIIDNYLHQVLDVGTFHADPHQGNLMVSKGVPYWIDFGMIGHLTDGNIKLIQDLILAIIQTDTEALVNAGMAMGAASPKTDRAKLTADLDSMINRYMSVTNLDDLDTAALLEDVTDVLGSNYIKIPGQYTMLIRSIATIEGVIEQLCPQLNLFKMITDKLLDRAKKSFDIQKALLDTGKDAVALGKKAAKIPVLISDVLNSVAKGRTKINLELTGYQELMNQVTEMVKAVIMALFSCVLFFGSCILCMTNIQPKTPTGIPLLAVAGFIFSISLGIYTIKRLIRKPK